MYPDQASFQGVVNREEGKKLVWTEWFVNRHSQATKDTAYRP